MTQHSNELVTPRLRNVAGSDSPLASPWVKLLSSFHSLLAHIGIMLGVTACLTILNLVVDPADVWSRAILVIWLVLVIAHGIGIVIVRLLSDEPITNRDLPRVQAEPHGAPTSSWAQAMAENPTTSGPQSEGDETRSRYRDASWNNAADANGAPDLAWPEPPAPDSDAEQSSSDSVTRQDEDAADRNEKVPWRAATEIAWMRRRQDAEEDPGRRRQDPAS